MRVGKGIVTGFLDFKLGKAESKDMHNTKGSANRHLKPQILVGDADDDSDK